MDFSIKKIAIIFLCLLITNFPMTETPKGPKKLSKDFMIIGHRGAPVYAPEHTIPSYELALNMGADYIEIDLQMTRDQVLVAMHDSTVDRTTNGHGKVHSFTIKELQKLNAGSWFNKEYPKYANRSFQSLRVPSLNEIFNHFGRRANYYIEIKHSSQSEKMEKQLISLLRKHKLINNGQSNVIIESFSSESLKRIHRIEPSIPLIQLLSYHKKGKVTNKELSKIHQYASGIGPNYLMIDAQLIKNAHKNGLVIHPFTINDRDKMLELLKLGIDGAFTDIPDEYKNIVNNNKAAD